SRTRSWTGPRARSSCVPNWTRGGGTSRCSASPSGTCSRAERPRGLPAQGEQRSTEHRRPMLVPTQAPENVFSAPTGTNTAQRGCRWEAVSAGGAGPGFGLGRFVVGAFPRRVRGEGRRVRGGGRGVFARPVARIGCHVHGFG